MLARLFGLAAIVSLLGGCAILWESYVVSGDQDQVTVKVSRYGAGIEAAEKHCGQFDRYAVLMRGTTKEKVFACRPRSV